MIKLILNEHQRPGYEDIWGFFKSDQADKSEPSINFGHACYENAGWTVKIIQHKDDDLHFQNQAIIGRYNSQMDAGLALLTAENIVEQVLAQ